MIYYHLKHHAASISIAWLNMNDLFIHNYKLNVIIKNRPLCSLYSPSEHSVHSKQHVGLPSMMPFLVPGSHSSLQLENGTWI